MCRISFPALVLLILSNSLCTADFNSNQEVITDIDYQARFTINVLNRAESCFYLENMREGYIINLHYIVISTKNGVQLDIAMRMKDPDRKLLAFHARRKEGHYTNYKVIIPGDYEICFNNRYSMYESKKVMWEVDVEGDELDDDQEFLKLFINRTMEEFQADSEQVLLAIKKVRHGLARARHQQYWIKSKSTKDSERMDTLKGMVDKWSSVNSCVVFVVMVAQVIALRSLFNVKPVSSKLNVRA